MAEFKFFCPLCGKQIQCDAGYSGTQINCPACNQAIVAPAAPGSGAPAAQPPAPAKPRTLRNVLLVAASLVVLAGLAAAGWLGYSQIRNRIILRGHFPSDFPPGLVAFWPGDGKGDDSIGREQGKVDGHNFCGRQNGPGVFLQRKEFEHHDTRQPVFGCRLRATVSPSWRGSSRRTSMASIRFLQWTDSDNLNLWIGVRPFRNRRVCAPISGSVGGKSFCGLHIPEFWPAVFSGFSSLRNWAT